MHTWKRCLVAQSEMQQQDVFPSFAKMESVILSKPWNTRKYVINPKFNAVTAHESSIDVVTSCCGRCGCGCGRGYDGCMWVNVIARWCFPCEVNYLNSRIALIPALPWCRTWGLRRNLHNCSSQSICRLIWSLRASTWRLYKQCHRSQRTHTRRNHYNSRHRKNDSSQLYLVTMSVGVGVGGGGGDCGGGSGGVGSDADRAVTLSGGGCGGGGGGGGECFKGSQQR